MPNLQTWLNAWVNVNVPTRPRSRSGSRSRRRNSGRHQSTRSTTGGTNNNNNNNNNAGAQYHENSVVAGIDTVRKDDGTSNSSSLASTFDSPGTSTIKSSISCDPELAAIRKFNAKKHKRRLHRTNSFSDILREKAEESNKNNNRSSRDVTSGGVGQRYSGERNRRLRNTDMERGRLQGQDHRHHGQSPPTLHHPLSDVDEQQGVRGDISEVSSSNQGYSPTETATTVHRSNKQSCSSARSRYHESDADEHSSVSSNSAALFEVADFFGADRPLMKSSSRQTHRAQHGLEDEQPHYLRSYAESSESTSAKQHLQHLQQPSTSRTYTRHSSNASAASSSSSSSTRPHQINQHLQPRSTYAAAAPNRYYDQDITSSALMPPSHAAIETDRPIESGLVIGGVRLPFFSSAASATSDSNNPGQNVNNHAQIGADNNIKKNPFGGRANCPGCKVAQAELQHTQESLEYMREMAIQKEYCCSKCGSDATAIKTPTLKKSSQQLSLVTERHQKQVATLMREKNHWQSNMQLKLEKFAHLCDNMNNESAVRGEDYKALQNELENVRTERDQLIGEVNEVRAAAIVHEKEREDHRRVQERMTMYENRGLQQLEHGIKKRDETIAQLSARLETSLDTLAKEREQQRQRRQIFFPKSSGNAHHDDSTTVGNNQADNSQQAEVERLRAELLEAQRKMETCQLEAKQRETALLFRCDVLEKQVNQSGGRPPAKLPPPGEK